MKKILLLTLLLTNCGQGVISTNEELEKKAMCAEYKDEAEANIEKYNLDYSGNGYETLSLEEIFYSPVRNSCLYAASGMMVVDGPTMQETFWTHMIFDALTSENLYSSTMNCEDRKVCAYNMSEAQALFSDEVEYYKGLNE